MYRQTFNHKTHINRKALNRLRRFFYCGTPHHFPFISMFLLCVIEWASSERCIRLQTDFIDHISSDISPWAESFWVIWEVYRGDLESLHIMQVGYALAHCQRCCSLIIELSPRELTLGLIRLGGAKISCGSFVG